MRRGIRRGLRTALAGSLLSGGVIVASIIAGSQPASAAPAVSLYVAVGGSGNCTTQVDACGAIQTAINSATGGSYAGDDVTINVAAGTYTENDTIAASSLNSLTLAGAGTSTTTVNETIGDSVFTVSNGIVTISGLTVSQGGDNFSGGGGIANDGTLTLSNSTVQNNFNGIMNDGTLTVSNSSVSDNSASYQGDCGGISNGGTLTISNSSVSDNSAYYYGGGICNDGTATVSDSNVTDNWVVGGGAGIMNDGKLTVTASTVSGNYVTSDGEGESVPADEAVGGGLLNGGTLTVSDSTLWGNSAWDGGGIYNGGTATVTNSTLTENTANSFSTDGGGSGGGIYNSSTLTVIASTVAGNDAAFGIQAPGVTLEGGGIYNSGTVHMGATIVAANTTPSGDANCYGSVTDEGYNIDGDGSCGFNGTAETHSSNLDASLGALANNGGPTETILPTPTSPAVGVIPTGTTLNGVQICPRTDQRGVTSVGNCTIGAVEVPLCATGLMPHILNATYGTDTFTGLFCVNAKGTGTYTQATATGTVSGFGSVTTFGRTRLIGALGKNLFLAGATNGTRSGFVEAAPLKAIGTFSLS